ncbi:MAG TPA: hypothetical protein VER79_14425 [Candidatus Limnocylindrales bacterium]|nr:hypothetical protein [Candidatus Limnocylindrales bacterium]
MNDRHFALYFTPEHMAAARAGAASPPLSEAWVALRERQPGGPLDFGFRTVFLDEAESAQRALGGLLLRANAGAGERRYIERAAAFVAHLQAFEMVRSATGLEPDELRHWLAYAADEGAVLLAGVPLPPHEALWRNLVRMALAIVLEQPEQAEVSAAEFGRVIAEDVRPQGFMSKVVAGEDGGGLFRQIEATAALVLTAEAGQGAGYGLWDVEVRGVSALTAALLPHYYFYDTAKWKWDRGVPPEDVKALFYRFGGYLEMVNRRMPNKDIQIVLEDLRPLNTPLAGGWTTLSHGLVEKKRRGLFG